MERLSEPPNTPQKICLLHGSRNAVKASILLYVLRITHSFPHPCGWQLEGRSAVLLHPLCSGQGDVGAASIPEGTAACCAQEQHPGTAGEEPSLWWRGRHGQQINYIALLANKLHFTTWAFAGKCQQIFFSGDIKDQWPNILSYMNKQIACDCILVASKLKEILHLVNWRFCQNKTYEKNHYYFT